MIITRSGAAEIRNGRMGRTFGIAALMLFGVACSSAKEDVASEQQASSTTAAGDEEPGCPPRPPRFWNNHTDGWPVASLTLGGTSYPEEQLVGILGTPLDDDASVILGRQLIAALLDVASGTDPSPVTATIAEANALLESGTIPLGVPIFSPLGLKMAADAAILDEFTHGRLTRACAAPAGACEAWSRLSVLPTGHDVVAYVAKGSWFGLGPIPTGIDVVNVEGTRVVPTLIPTPEAVSSCATNALTGRTVCTTSGTDVYLLSGTTLEATLTSGGTGTFLAGGCTTCGVTMDPIHDRALVGLGLMGGAGGGAGFQFLDLGSSPSFEPAFSSETSFDVVISTGALVDPYRNRILSPTEGGLSEIIDVTPGTSPAFFERQTGGVESAGEDCATQIVLPGPLDGLGPPEPANSFMTDLTQATFTPGSPGSWTAPLAYYTLSDSGDAKWGSVAVAQGTHTAVFAGDADGSNHFVAVALPPTSGSGTPAPVDYVACVLPAPLFTDDLPQAVTAYKSPNSGDAMAVFVTLTPSVNGGGPETMVVIDLTKMFDHTIVPRDAAGHACASGALPASVFHLVDLP